MKDGTLRFGGMPTDAEVNMLMERFGKPEEKIPIPYTEVEKTLHFARDGKTAGRWKTVTNAWRQRLRRLHHVEMSAGGGCFTPLPPGDRVVLSASRVHRGSRQFRKASDLIRHTERARLDDAGKKNADHIQVIASAVQFALRTEARKPPRELPAGVEKK